MLFHGFLENIAASIYSSIFKHLLDFLRELETKKMLTKIVRRPTGHSQLAGQCTHPNPIVLCSTPPVLYPSGQVSHNIDVQAEYVVERLELDCDTRGNQIRDSSPARSTKDLHLSRRKRRRRY